MLETEVVSLLAGMHLNPTERWVITMSHRCPRVWASKIASHGGQRSELRMISVTADSEVAKLLIARGFQHFYYVLYGHYKRFTTLCRLSSETLRGQDLTIVKRD